MRSTFRRARSSSATATRRLVAVAGLGLAIQTVFLVAFAATDAYDSARTGEGLRLLATYADVVALFVLAHVLFASAPSCSREARGARIARIVLYSVFVLINFARFETTGAFDYGFFHGNVRELLNPLGRRIVTAQVRPAELLFFLALPLALGLLVMRRWPAPPWALTQRSRLLVAALCVGVLVGFPAARISTHESITAFAASAYRFHVQSRDEELALGGAQFPLVHDFVPSTEARALSTPDEAKPHVIVLFLESWSGIYNGRASASGRAYTPVFDAHRQEGLTVDHFYASSIQSSRGRFATMCSLIPLYRGKEFEVLADAQLHCLPHVLRDAGYETMIYSASDEPSFERSTEFFDHLGFQDVRFEDPEQRAHDPRVWGAGLRDDVYYEKFFAALDDKAAQQPGTPLFAVAINASNHYPFSDDPAHVPDAEGTTKYSRNYVASLRQADTWLTTFFAELDRRPAFRDAIVVLVGDHSFPADEHGIHFNALGAREESFRTSFALRWRGHVTPTFIRDRAASQLDLAPTIADLLQLRHSSSFQGHSLIASSAPVSPVPMVQPYDGVRLAAVLYPFKLEVHDSAMQEHLYDLSSDPDEQHDLLGTPALASQTAVLRAEVDRIRASNAILRAKRVWPDGTNERVSISR